MLERFAGLRLLVVGHTDTVPLGLQPWTVDPFATGRAFRVPFELCELILPLMVEGQRAALAFFGFEVVVSVAGVLGVLMGLGRLRSAPAMALAGKPKIVLLDEPAGGVNLSMLAEVKDRLVEINRTRNTTLIVIEHNMEVIKSADYIIDLGPDGGDKGGQLVVAGTPEEVAEHKTSYTGHYLRDFLKR